MTVKYFTVQLAVKTSKLRTNIEELNGLEIFSLIQVVCRIQFFVFFKISSYTARTEKTKFLKPFQTKLLKGDDLFSSKRSLINL